MRCFIHLLLFTISIAKDILFIPKTGSSTNIALENGMLFYNTIQEAIPGDNIILDNHQVMYFIPYDILTNLYNITIKLNSNIFYTII